MAVNPFVALQPRTLYRFPDTSVLSWIKSTPGDKRMPAIRDRIGQYPVAMWVGPGSVGRWIAGYSTDAATKNQLPVYVAYGLMARDVGQWSAGGAKSLGEYLTWAGEFAAAIGTRPAVLIIEPDSLIHMPSLTPAQQDLRLQALRGLISTFSKAAPNTALYLDAGDAYYNTPEFIAPWLVRAGLGPSVRGFAANVSNYNPTPAVRAFATKVIALLRAKGISGDIGYVIDTSRNGNGRPTDDYINQHRADWWCNWPDTRIGDAPRVAVTPGAEDAQLWIKHIGESDGGCGAAPASDSGEFLPDLAYRYIRHLLI